MVSLDNSVSGCDKLTEELDFMIFRCILTFFSRLLSASKVSLERFQATFRFHPHIRC